MLPNHVFTLNVNTEWSFLCEYDTFCSCSLCLTFYLIHEQQIQAHELTVVFMTLFLRFYFAHFLSGPFFLCPSHLLYLISLIGFTLSSSTHVLTFPDCLFSSSVWPEPLVNMLLITFCWTSQCICKSYSGSLPRAPLDSQALETLIIFGLLTWIIIACRGSGPVCGFTVSHNSSFPWTLHIVAVSDTYSLYSQTFNTLTPNPNPNIPETVLFGDSLTGSKQWNVWFDMFDLAKILPSLMQASPFIWA